MRVMSVPQVMQSAEALTRMQETIQDELTNGEETMLLDAPAWLTKDYLESCLKKYYEEPQLSINHFDAQPALGKGENYGGILTRITADVSMANGAQRNAHYIVKTSFEGDEFARKAMEPYDIFNREMRIYENVLPKLSALLQAAGDTEQLFAETLAVDSARSALVFEDLKVRGFVMADRIQGFDMDLAKLALQKLAKMHAASAVLNQREHGSLEVYDRGMFNRHTDNYAPCFVGLLEACGRLVAQWGDEFELYARKIRTLKPMYMELCKRVFDPIAGYLNVLAHGDFWTNNVMVKYDAISGKPVDAIIIDFQYTVWGSPAIDLFYLLNTSLEEDIHVGGQDVLIQHYYTVLADTLRNLNFMGHIPSLHNFHLQLEEKFFYAFNSTCVVQPVQRNQETDDADFNALMKEDERAVNFKNTCYKNPYCQRIIRKMLPVYERKGLLDVDQ